MVSILFRLFHSTRRLVHQRKLAMFLVIFSMWAYATTGFMYFELPAKPDLQWSQAAWWAVVTMTTVGYGDYFPETVAGQIWVGYPTMLLGVALLGYLLSIVAGAIMESQMLVRKGMKQIHDSNHIIICHCNGIDQTLKLISELRRDEKTANSEIVLIDPKLGEIPREIAEAGVKFVSGDPGREPVLESANFREANCVFIRPDMEDPQNTDHKNLPVALTIERCCPEVRTIVECMVPSNAIFFERAGCDSVICLQALASQVVAQELQDPGLHRVIEELTSNAFGTNFQMLEMPETITKWEEARTHFDASEKLILGVIRHGKNYIAPPPEFQIEAGDQAITICSEGYYSSSPAQ